MLTWLADVLRGAGLPVVELDGWRTRSRSGGIDPRGIVWHHTATPSGAQDSTVDRILRDGRSDLPGPLSQLGLRRDGTFVVVAAGRCNHNIGTWGNDSIGIEAYNDGVGEPWPTVQVDAYIQGTAAICRHLGWGADRVKAHRETDPTRKVDPKGIDMTAARGRIASLLTQPREDDDDMAQSIVWYRSKDGGEHAYRVWGILGVHIPTLAEVDALKAFGVSEFAPKSTAGPPSMIALLDGPCQTFGAAGGSSAAQVADEIAKRMAG